MTGVLPAPNCLHYSLPIHDPLGKCTPVPIRSYGPGAKLVTSLAHCLTQNVTLRM